MIPSPYYETPPGKHGLVGDLHIGGVFFLGAGISQVMTMLWHWLPSKFWPLIKLPPWAVVVSFVLNYFEILLNLLNSNLRWHHNVTMTMDETSTLLVLLNHIPWWHLILSTRPCPFPWWSASNGSNPKNWPVSACHHENQGFQERYDSIVSDTLSWDKSEK